MIEEAPAVVEVEARRILAVVQRVRWREIGLAAMPALDRVWAHLRSNNVSGLGHNLFLYRDSDHDGCEACFGVEVPASVEAPEGFVITATPAGRAATVAHYGSYDGLFAANTVLRDWCAEHHHQLTGVTWELYGDWSDDPARLRTDIFYEVATSAG